jgi:hypothetical protein
MANKNCLEDFYNRLKNDLEYREYVKKNTKQAMCELHSVESSSLSNVRFEVIDQADDTITIVIPSRPTGPLPDQKSIKRAADQTVDFLYKRGMPGFLIPNDRLRWVLLTIRKNWFQKEGVV